MKKIHPYQKSKLLSNRIMKYLMQKAAEFETRQFHQFGRLYREKARRINHQVNETN